MAITRRPASGRIVHDRAVLGGEPIIRGTRLAVRHIVLVQRERGSARAVIEAYPQLTEADVDDALTYYAKHRAEVDRSIAANLAEE